MRPPNHQLLRRTIRQQDFEIRGLLQHINNIDQTNDAKNQALSDLQSEKHSLQEQLIRQEKGFITTLTKLQTAINDYQSRLQELTDENVLLKDNLVFCVKAAILLMLSLIITPTIVKIYLEFGMLDQAMDIHNFVESEEYEKLKVENEELLSQIEELNQNHLQLGDADMYARLQQVQQQLKYTIKQNDHLRKAHILPKDQETKIEEMQQLISNKNQNLLRYKNELLNANNEIERLRILINDSFANITSVNVLLTPENVLNVSNTKTNGSVTVYRQRPVIVQLIVFLIIAMMHYIAYKLWNVIQNGSCDWFSPRYWLQKKERKKWNRGADGRLVSRFSKEFTLSSFKY